MTLPPFTMVAPLAGADGYGQSAEQLILHGTGLGADIALVSHDWQDRRFTSSALFDLEYPDSEVKRRALSVIYFLPFAFALERFRSKVTLGMTMFETTRAPDFWMPGCNRTNGLIVPSEHCARAFAAADVPVRVAPLGVDTNFYRRAPPGERPGGRCRFLMAGLLHYRKGAEFAVRAFREEFTVGEDVKLVLKTRRGFLDVGNESLDDPRIMVIDDDWSREDMRTAYQDADAFIASSRGEAAGLTPREAMACGTPVILTEWGGLAELAGPGCYLTGIDGLEPAPASCSSYGENVAGRGPIGEFCRPSVTGIRRAMRSVYEDRAQARAKGRAGRRFVAEHFNWSRCAGLWLDCIEELWSLG